MRRIRVLTRRSDLALTQAAVPIIPLLGEKSRKQHGLLPVTYEIVPTDVIGDKSKFNDFSSVTQSSDADNSNQKSMWFEDIDLAIASGVADIGVHSGKDVPAQIHPATVLFPILAREDPRDVFISRHGISFNQLAHGAKIGTSSSRRRAQLSRLRPDLKFPGEYKGNVPTRVQFSTMDARGVDGIVLAAAGIVRLGVQIPREIHDHLEPFPIETVLPCVNQGIIVVQCRRDDEYLCNAVRERLVYQDTLDVWTAERAVLEATNADCKEPIAMFALLHKGDILVTARAFSDDGRKMVEIVDTAPRHRADSIGRDIGHRLLEKIHAERIW